MWNNVSIEYTCKENACMSYYTFVKGPLHVHVSVSSRSGEVGCAPGYRSDGGSTADCWSNSGSLSVYEVRVIMNLLLMNLWTNSIDEGQFCRLS